MPKETIAAALEASTPAAPAPSQVDPTDITGLPTITEAPSHAVGTVAELLAHKRADAKAEPKPEEAAREKKLDEVDKKLQEMLFKGKPRKKVEAEPATPEPAAIAPVTDPPAPAPDPEPKPARPVKKVVVKDRATELREQELELERKRLELERERLELEKASRIQAPSKDESGLEQLSPDERYELEIFKVMAGDVKYKDLPGRFTDVAKATAKYRAAWEKDHPGEAFNPDDTDHDEFFAKNQVKYDKLDFKRAEQKKANEGSSDPRLEKLEQSNRDLMSREKLRELQPRIEQVWLKHADAMVEAIDPDISKAARDGGPEKMIKDFPEESEEIVQAANALKAISIEAHKLLDGDGLFAPSAQNRAHSRILDIIRQQERIIPQQPREQRLDADGRDFATWDKWVTLSDQEQANFWHLGADEVVDIVSRDLAARVKYELDRASKLGEARVKRKTPNPETTKEKPTPARSPAASPGAASKTTVDAPARAATPGEDKITKIIREGLFKRSS